MPFIVNEDMFVGVPIDGEVEHGGKEKNKKTKTKKPTQQSTVF